MAEIQDKIQPTEHLNRDDSDRSLPKGDVRDRLNCRVHVTQKGQDGDTENTQGNTLVTHPLPSGTNKTIGTYEDQGRKRIIYFNYNSNGNHGIYQYLTAEGVIETIKEEPLLGFDVNKKITGINVVEDLLFWTDHNQRPRKINIEKANDTDKLKKYDVFFQNINPAFVPNNFNATTEIRDASGVLVLTWITAINLSPPTPYTVEEAVTQYLAGVPAGAAAFVTFTTCYQSITADMITSGYTLKSYSSLGPFSSQRIMAIANNFYPSPFKEEFIDAIKYPTICQPLVAVKVDSTRRVNLIQDKVFQFRIKLIYDDNEKSVWSPYSAIADQPVSCGATSTQSDSNYIEVDFNSDRLPDEGSLSIINRVEIAVREHNTDKLMYVTQVERWQFLAYGSKYNFYNDIIPSEVDPAETVKNYDSLPLLAKSQEFSNGRLLYGGIEEGYDPICLDAKLNLTYDATPIVNTFSFSGKIYIKNLFAYQSKYQESQPIHDYQDGNGYVFGGFGNSDVVNQIGTSFGQKIPLGGFVMYLAGTYFRAVSKQPIFSTYGINQDSNGVMNSDTTGNGLILSCGSANIAKAKQRKKIRCQIENGGIWSSFTMKDIPPGKYILRVASHLTTAADLGGASLAWQKTSTYTLQVAAPVANATLRNEAVIEIKTNGDIYVNGAFTATANGSIGDTHIADLGNPTLGDDATGITGYLTDADIAAPPITPSALLGDTRIDLAKVALSYNFTTQGINYTSFVGYNDFASKEVYTDHNGFFWWVSFRRSAAAPLNVNYVNVIGNQQNVGAFTQYDMSAGAFVPNNSLGVNSGILRISTSGVFNNQRTILEGNVVFNGNPISDLNIVSTRGGFDPTDASGDFNLVVYGDTFYYFNISGAQKIRADQVLFAVNGNCIITFNPNSIAYSILFGTGSSQYNFTSPFPISGITITSILGQSSEVALKRGGNYKVGIVYYDNAIRDNNVNIGEGLDLKIPFYTEIDPATGVIVGQSKPIVEMEINNPPPSWATHYQIVRTLNGTQGRFLQWTAKTVTYVDDDGNITTPALGTQVKIDLGSTINYKDQNVDSLVSYVFEEGDRMVLIKNGATGNFYSDYYDFKIKGSKTGAVLVMYIDNLVSVGQIPVGTLFEVYNPLKKQDINLYYEIGECYPIVNGQHTGNVQNQTASQPAKVKLTTGDTYYRLRNIPYSTVNTIGSPADASKSWYIEDSSISDFYLSEDQTIGRFHIYNKDFGKRVRPSVIRFSNTYLPETKINNLNSFEGLSEKVLPLDYGLIQKLILARDTLCAIFNNSQFLSMFMGKDMLANNQLQSLVAISDKVIQDSYQYTGGLGTQNPESISIDEDNVISGYDNEKGIVWQRNVNGLVPISEIKAETYWRDRSNEIKAGAGTFVYGFYDNSYKQVGFSIEGTPTARPSIEADTMVYNKKKKQWESRYSFQPEYYGGGRSNVLVAFLNGELWRSHSNTLYNNFFGVQYTSRIKVIASDPSAVMKIFQYLSTESQHVWSTTPAGIRTLEGQQSELESTDFELIENVFRASILKDINTPNVATPIIEGDDMRSAALIVELENKETGYSSLDAVNIYSIQSQSTNK